jgi:hypothetical protein
LVHAADFELTTLVPALFSVQGAVK